MEKPQQTRGKPESVFKLSLYPRESKGMQPSRGWGRGALGRSRRPGAGMPTRDRLAVTQGPVLSLPLCCHHLERPTFQQGVAQIMSPVRGPGPEGEVLSLA